MVGVTYSDAVLLLLVFPAADCRGEITRAYTKEKNKVALSSCWILFGKYDILLLVIIPSCFAGWLLACLYSLSRVILYSPVSMSFARYVIGPMARRAPKRKWKSLVLL